MQVGSFETGNVRTTPAPSSATCENSEIQWASQAPEHPGQQQKNPNLKRYSTVEPRFEPSALDPRCSGNPVQSGSKPARPIGLRIISIFDQPSREVARPASRPDPQSARSRAPRGMGLRLQPTASVTGATQTLGIPFVDARITILPRFIRVPDERSLNGRSWKSRHLEQIECMTHDLTLHRTISRLPTRIAEWKIAEEKSWNATFFDNVAGGADDHCRDPLRFEIACDQTHGLVTDRSERDE